MGRKLVKGGDYRPSVALTREAKDALADWIEKNNRPEQGLVVSKLIEWFVRQRPFVQQAVLAPPDDDAKEAYAAVLVEIARFTSPQWFDLNERVIFSADGRGVAVGGAVPTAKDEPDTESTRSHGRSGRAGAK